MADEVETELKFEVRPDRAAALIAELADGRAHKARKLRSVYFDTAGQALRKAGFALRVRADGKVRTQTIKTMNGGPSRGEWEARANKGEPDRNFVKSTPAGAALDGSALAPLFAVDVERSSIDASEGTAKVEASLDRGSAVGRGRSSPISELELELKSGEKAALFAFAARLRRQFDLRPEFSSKAKRGFALLKRRKAPGRRFECPRLTAKISAGAAFKHIALAALEQIATNAQELDARDHPETVHQLRVGVRRLRSALHTFEAVLADARYETVKAELEWLSGELDAARNLDVLMAGAVRRAERQGGRRRALKALRRDLEGQRAMAYARARQAAGGERLSALLFDVLMWIEIGPWTAEGAAGAEIRDAPLGRFAAVALAKARRQTVKRGRGFKRLDRPERHKLRISAKRQRYAAEVVGQVFTARPKRSARFLARTKALLDCLGELNDIATAERLLSQTSTPKALHKAQTRREKQLLVEARKAYQDWRKAPAFWPQKT